MAKFIPEISFFLKMKNKKEMGKEIKIVLRNVTNTKS